MQEPEFYWGTFARAIFIAMLWFSVVIAWVKPQWLAFYMPALVFLALGLRPLLVKTGLYRVCMVLLEEVDDRRWKKRNEIRRREVDLKERDKRYRHRRERDPRLPRNW